MKTDPLDPLDSQRKARTWLKARGAVLGAAIVKENDEMPETVRKDGRAELTQVAAALERQEEGLYGICEGCGAEIDASRLTDAPYATSCASCASPSHG
jgi:DnaK suppressor protein